MFLPDPFAKAQKVKEGDAGSVDGREMSEQLPVRTVENEPLGSGGTGQGRKREPAGSLWLCR